MTSDTDQRSRLRAIFLSYIVIMSVFAGVTTFSGIAAAANAPGGNAQVIDTDNTNSDTVSQVGSTVEVANVSFGDDERGNVSNVTVELAGSNSEDVEPGDIQSVGVALRNNSSDTTLESEINSSIDSDVDVNQINLSDFGGTPSSNVTNVSQVVVNVTSAGNDGAIVNASFEAFANDGTSDFGSDDSTGLVTTQNTQTLDGGIATESTVDADEDGAPSAPTVNVSFQSVSGIDSNSVNISVRNLNVSGDNETILVENGNVINGSATNNSNFTDGNNNNVEFANISVPTLGEGFYTVNASVNTSNANQFTNNTLNNRNSDFNFDRVGSQLELITDSRNPLAGNVANITVVAQDDDGNRLNFNESDVNVAADDLSLTARDSGDARNATIDLNVSDSRRPVANTTADSPANQFDVFFNVSFSEASDLELQVRDTGTTGDVLSIGEATQTFTAEADSIELITADGELTADGSDTENVTLRLVDQNGDPIPRSGERIEAFVGQDNSTNAGLTRIGISPSDGETSSSGISVASFNATTDGFNVSVFAQATTSLGSTFTETAFINTVSGDINAQNSDFEIDQSTDDLSAKAGTTHDIGVTLRDSENNAISDASVGLSANLTGVSFANQTPQTNSSGIATTTMTLPENNQPVQINVSAGPFNASTTGAAQNNVSVSAENTTELRFATDTRSLPANQDDVAVTVEGIDEFGNINTTNIGAVTLASSDIDVFSFDDDENDPVGNDSIVARNGTAEFNVDVGQGGTATLSATIPGANISNASAEFDATGPTDIEVTFSSSVSTSSNGNTNNTATLRAQLLDPNGNTIGVSDETVSFARQDGTAAELNESQARSGSFEANTNSDGVATFGVNASDTEGETTFLAIAENFSAQGTGTVTTTGAVDTINITPADSAIDRNSTTTVTTTFEDGSGRIVPRTDSISLQAENGSVTGSPNTTQFVNGDAQATFTYNASTTDSSVDLTAVGGSVTGSATITVEEAQAAEPSVSVNFTDQTVPNGTEEVTVDSANFTRADGSAGDYVVVVHTIDEFGAPVGNVSDPIGASGDLTDGEENITVDLTAADGPIDSITENVTLRAMLHTTANDSAFGTRLGNAIDGIERGDETDDANITVEEAQAAEPSVSVNFTDQTVPNGTEEVTVDSANFTRADGSAGDYVVVVHTIDEFGAPVGNVSDPIGASGDLTDGEENITVDLTAADGPIDSITENVTLRAMLHTTANDSAFGTRLGNAIDGIERGDETDDANITVEEAVEDAPANFEVSDLEPQDATVNVSEAFDVSVTVENTGDLPGTQNIELLTEPENGSVLATESNVSLDSGANTTVTFDNVTVDDTAGEFNHTVASANDSVSGNLTVEQQEQVNRSVEVGRQFAGEDDVIGSFDLLDAVEAFRNGEIDDPFTVLDLIEFFRNETDLSQV